MSLKKIIFILIVLFSNSMLFGQTAKQIDYFKTLNLNLSDLQDYMIALKFEFNGSKTDELGVKYSWTYARNRNNNKAERFYSLYLNNDGTKNITLESIIVEDYRRFKVLIKQKGLLFLKSENIEDALVETFSNSIYECRIWNYVGKEGFTTYEMTLSKK